MQHLADSASQHPSQPAVTVDDAALVRAAAAGDQDAWSALVERFAGLVWATARAHGLSPEEAASAAHVTWLRLVQHLGRMPQPAYVSVWLAATTRRESLRILSLRRQRDLNPLRPTLRNADGDRHE